MADRFIRIKGSASPACGTPFQPQTAGSYLYEPGGAVHTLYIPEDNIEDTVLFVRVCGANINFDDTGQLHSILDALSIRVLTDTLSAAQGLPAPRYIEAPRPASASRLPAAPPAGLTVMPAKTAQITRTFE